MPFLVRKIDKGKWLTTDLAAGADIAADAITGCLRTSRNTLSAWKIENRADVGEAALAMTAAGQHLETIDLVVYDENEFKAGSVPIENTPDQTQTPVLDLRNRHHDLIEMNYGRLGVVARLTAAELVAKRDRRFTQGELKKILSAAVAAGRLQKTDLNPNILKKLQMDEAAA